jgi:hypothetical protein
MHASRKILLKHFDARAAEYHTEIFSDDNKGIETNPDDADNPVCLSLLFFSSFQTRCLLSGF